ncbi:hypothetical protein ACOMHN_011081 [Nucella lapillus]
MNVRRQSLSSLWKEERSLVEGLLPSSSTSSSPPPQRRLLLLKPVQSLSIDNVTSGADFRGQAETSPGPLSTQYMWSASDLIAPPAHHDVETMSNVEIHTVETRQQIIFPNVTAKTGSLP